MTLLQIILNLLDLIDLCPPPVVVAGPVPAVDPQIDTRW